MSGVGGDYPDYSRPLGTVGEVLTDQTVSGADYYSLGPFYVGAWAGISYRFEPTSSPPPGWYVIFQFHAVAGGGTVIGQQNVELGAWITSRGYVPVTGPYLTVLILQTGDPVARDISVSLFATASTSPMAYDFRDGVVFRGTFPALAAGATAGVDALAIMAGEASLTVSSTQPGVAGYVSRIDPGGGVTVNVAVLELPAAAGGTQRFALGPYLTRVVVRNRAAVAATITTHLNVLWSP